MTATAVGLLSGLRYWSIAVLVILGGILYARSVWPGDAMNSPREAKCELAIVGSLLSTALFLSAWLGGAGRPFTTWFYRLPLDGAQHVTATQALLGICGAVFLLASANRIVRATLVIAGNSLAKRSTESKPDAMRGGRYIGIAERLIVAGMLLAGSAAGAGIIIAAKSVIRLPELRSRVQSTDGAPDEIAEYFLIGTLTSMVVAAAIALIVLAA